MPYCPKCKYEYLPSRTTCPDCGAALVDKLPALEAPQPILEPLVAVYEAPDEVMCVMVRGLLEDAGIAVAEQSGRVPWYDDVRVSAGGYHTRLLVFQSQAATARRLIAEYLAEIEARRKSDPSQ